MKVGMNLLLWTTDVGEHLYPVLDQLKDVGFDGVEVPIGDEGDAKYDALGDQLRSLDLGCTCVTSIFEDGNPASSDPQVRQRAVDQMKWRIDRGQALGAEVICGPYHSAFAWFSGQPPREDERKYAAEVLRQAAEYAQQADIVLTPEALNRFECYLYNTLDDIAKLIREVDHPNCQMIFDSHHAHIEEKDSAAMIRKHANLIKHVHISENDRGTPGRGQVRWQEIFAALKEIRYDGWLTIEAFSRNKPEFASGINVWRNFAESMEEVYKGGYEFIRDSF